MQCAVWDYIKPLLEGKSCRSQNIEAFRRIFVCLSHPSRSHPIYLFLLGRIILLISGYLLFNTIYIAHYLSFVCEYLCVFVRLERSVHLEVLGKQGLENDSQCVAEIENCLL